MACGCAACNSPRGPRERCGHTAALPATRLASQEGGAVPPHRHASAFPAPRPVSREGSALPCNFVLT
ncbi:hypothetical protein TIFTF001_035161 [Ficus carica]|uniref:Uncharacterized protein n=1 Tax=Ficus carica TaxID=3494 RepID=A0AA88E532_FICCA|nr:hypothetical protein TIFTF001_035161 [Ficus carica]